MALFARVLKSLGCFLTRCPKTVWFGSHRLKTRYIGRLESLIELTNNITKDIKKRKENKAKELELKNPESKFHGHKGAYNLELNNRLDENTV